LSLHILYTANLRGNLELLPRLYTFIKQLRRDVIRFAPEDEDEVMVCHVQPPTPPRILLLDLGDSCAPDAWHCAATGGRSMLIALDAMGYDAANVTGLLTAESRDKLRENILGMALVDENQTWANGDIQVVGDARRGGGQSLPYKANIDLNLSDKTRLEGRMLSLARVEGGQVGTAQVGGLDAQPVLLAHAIFDLPPNTAPDPTIAGTVDFILAEARRYTRKGDS
jgi:hypothetical protein